MNPLISIILPIYEVKKSYAKKCINSIKSQTYENYEVICIFDGSKKETIESCKSIIGTDKKFKIISRENKGVSFTRNEGIEKCSGEWITFIDADDWFENDALETFIKNLKNDATIDFYIFKTYINSKENPCKYNSNHLIDEEKKKELFQSTFGTKYGKYSYCESVWKNYYKKEAIMSNNIKFPNNIKIGEDMLFNYQVWSKCNNGYFVNKAIYNYRINDESVMNGDYKQLKNKYEKLFPEYEKVIKAIDKKYTTHYSNFIIRQIKRFYLNYGNEQSAFEEITKLTNDNYYKKNIKKTKTTSMNIKNGIFLIALKFKNKSLIKKIIRLYNK